MALLALPPAHAQSKVGTTALAFLEIGVGARNVALGEAGVTLAQDATALYWNPAGIAALTGTEVSFQYSEWFAGTSLQYFGGVLALGNLGAVGVHAYVFDSGEMDERTLEFEDGTGERFRVQDLALGLSYARPLTDNFTIGATVKYLRARLFRMTASSVALDLGVRYQTPIRNLQLGFALSNFGNEMTLTGDNTLRRIDLDEQTAGDNDGILANLALQAWDLPLVFRIGLAYQVLQTDFTTVTVASEAAYPNNNNQYVNTGLEVGFRDLFFLRGGLSNLFLDDTYGQGHLRLGAGFKLANRLLADYAFVDRGDLGTVNMIGASVRF